MASSTIPDSSISTPLNHHLEEENETGSGEALPQPANQNPQMVHAEMVAEPLAVEAAPVEQEVRNLVT